MSNNQNVSNQDDDALGDQRPGGLEPPIVGSPPQQFEDPENDLGDNGEGEGGQIASGSQSMVPGLDGDDEEAVMAGNRKGLSYFRPEDGQDSQ